MRPVVHLPRLPAGAGLLAAGALLFGVGCERIDLERMIAQPSYRPYEAAPLFDDGMAMRTPPVGSVARERLLGPPSYVEGVDARVFGRWVDELPLEVDRALVLRGQSRFRVFCATCHGVAGDGRSQVAENMTLVPPPSLHDARIRELPPGRLFSVITHGWGLMPSYRDALEVRDRWAVVAYVQALQLSRSIPVAELPELLRKEASPWLK